LALGASLLVRLGRKGSLAFLKELYTRAAPPSPPGKSLRVEITGSDWAFSLADDPHGA
jgi:hypothetical protein